MLPIAVGDVPVFSATVSADETLIVSGDQSGLVRVWDGLSGQLMTDLKAYPEQRAHSDAVRSVVVSPVSLRLMDDNVPDRRDTEPADKAHRFQQLASGGKDGAIRLWNLEIRNRRVIDASKVSTLQFGDSQEVWRLAYSSDGKLIAAGGSGGSVCVWNTESLKLVDSFQPHDSYLKSLQFTDHDTKLITSGWRDHNGPTEFRILDLNDSSPTRHRGSMLRPTLNGNWHSGVAGTAAWPSTMALSSLAARRECSCSMS